MNLAPSRLLGLDVGDRRIGVAISDPDAHFALPLRSVERDRSGSELGALADLARDQSVGEIVVGLPLSLSGDSSAQTETTRAFARLLEQRLQLPVHLWDERLSTKEALRLTGSEQRRPAKGGRRKRSRAAEADTDALAATIILQAYLDHLRLSSGDGP